MFTRCVFSGLLLSVSLLPQVLRAASPDGVDVMPLPFRMVQKQGRLELDQSFRIQLPRGADERLRAAAQRFLTQLSRETGMPFDLPWQAAGKPKLLITSASAGPAVEALDEDESYRLSVEPEAARLTAKTDVGILRGLATLLQLVKQDERGYSISSVEIEDHPRFAWRGLLLDVTSHWMPVDVIKRNLDAMEAVKLNVFHWHISDDQGFRVESKRYPKLHELGSDGEFYTQEQVREVIAYAHARGIRVLPEFDMPGHCASWLVGYPELASAPGPYSIIHTFGVYDPALDPTREETYQFIDGLLDEMTALFPDEYFHIGGDEVNGKQWNHNPAIQEFIREHGLQNEHGLQTYFNRRLEALVRKHGKKMIGWDEVLHPDLPKDIVIQSWRDQESLATAAREGHPAILSFGYYLDHLDHAGYHYGIDPQGGPAKKLDQKAARRILGGEACMWTEFVSTETVDSRIWPKTAAIAERLWSPADAADVDSMYRRLPEVSERLGWTGVTHRSSYGPMLARLAGAAEQQKLQILADAVEPLGIEDREKAQHYSQASAYNRLVDAARGESLPLRNLEMEVRRLSRTAPGSADWNSVERVLRMWKENDEELSALLQQRFLLREAMPLSRELSELGSIGLQALAFVRSGKPAPGDWVRQQLGVLDQTARPQAEVTLSAVTAVRLLVRAAADRDGAASK